LAVILKLIHIRTGNISKIYVATRYIASRTPLIECWMWLWLDRRGVACAMHHEREVHYKKSTYTCVAWTSSNRVISPGDFYCCLLPQCGNLRSCGSGTPIAAPVKSFHESCVSNWIITSFTKRDEKEFKSLNIVTRVESQKLWRESSQVIGSSHSITAIQQYMEARNDLWSTFL